MNIAYLLISSLFRNKTIPILAVRYQYSPFTYIMAILDEQQIHIYRRLRDSTADGMYRSVSRTKMKTVSPGREYIANMYNGTKVQNDLD